MSHSPEVVSNADAGDGADMDGCDRHAAAGDGDRGYAGKLPPIKEPYTCHFYLLNQVKFENHGGAWHKSAKTQSCLVTKPVPYRHSGTVESVGILYIRDNFRESVTEIFATKLPPA